MQITPTINVAAQGVWWVLWSLPKTAGNILARPIANKRRDAPIKNPFQHVKIPRSPPMITILPKNGSP